MPKLLVLAGLATFAGEATRKLAENAVSLNGEKFLGKFTARRRLGNRRRCGWGRRVCGWSGWIRMVRERHKRQKQIPTGMTTKEQAAKAEGQGTQTLRKNLHLRGCGSMSFEIFFASGCAGWVAVGGSVAVVCGWREWHQDPKEIVRTAMQAELAADKNDHTRWRYRDAKKDGTDTVSIVVETDHGSVKRVIMRNGQPLNEAEARAEDERVQRFIHDPEKLAKQKRDGAQDGKNAEELLKMLPEAFTWKIVSEDAQKYTLHFDPNPSFSPPDMQGRVLGTMAGTLVVNKSAEPDCDDQREVDAGCDDWVGFAGAAAGRWDVPGGTSRGGAGILADRRDTCAHRGQGAVLQDDRRAAG